MSTQLSTAIREGAKLGKQAHSGVFEIGTPKCRKLCAIGGAARVVLGEGDDLFPGRIRAAFPVLNKLAKPPVLIEGLGIMGDTVYDIIVVLNDKAKWTRERIADWVESVEGATGEQP